MKYFYCKIQLLRQIIFLGFLTVGLFLALPALGLAAPGDLDPAFGNGGKVTTEFNFAHAVDVVTQADGKIIVAGTDESFNSAQFVIVRYHTDGSLDLSFGTGGKVFTSVGQFNYASCIAIQADGKIVVAGYAGTFGPIRDFVVVRYAPNGSLDASFDGDGKVSIDMGDDNFANDLVIQPDGKIVVGGASGTSQSARNFAFAIARLNSDGSLDSSFGGGGKVITSLGSFSDFGAKALALQQDGKIVAAGNRGSSGWTTSDFALVRYNSDGSLDASFDGDGIVITAVSNSGDGANEVALQSDGKIIAAGSAPDQAAIVRYNSNGSLDTSFSVDGIVFTDLGVYDSFSSVVIQSNGKIVAGGFNSEHVLVRYNPNGSLDTSFGGDGIVSTSFDNMGYPAGYPYGGIFGLAIQSDGRIVAVGNWGLDGEFQVFALSRYVGDAVVPNRKPFDFDGDGRADISVFRSSDRTWYLNRSSAGFTATQFGLSNDKIAPADFDGDGRTDIAVFRDGTWYLLRSTEGFLAVQFGLASDIPVPADFTGDGRAELAVYRGGVWYTLDLQNNQFNAVQFGLATDKPVVGDYDGDSRADFAIYREGVWYLLRSQQGFAAIQFGLPTDRLVPADYDGDGKTDIAVYRDGIWYLLRSQTGFTAFQFGIASDTPAPADYDGDGRTDAAVFRSGVWYLLQSTNGISIQQFGLANDNPVPSAY